MTTETATRKDLWAMKVRELVPTYRFAESAPHSKRIASSKDAETILRPLFGEMVDESVWALYVNGGNDLLAVYKISEGSTSEAPVCASKVIRGAVLTNASAILVAHCHPSGHSQPSASDRQMTAELVKVCELMRLPLVDHIVIGNGSGYFSFADRGLIEEYKRAAK